MTPQEAFATYLELRESTPDGQAAAGLSHSAAGLVLLHVLEVAAHGEPRGSVTVVHDAGGHGGRYRQLAERLAAEGWAVALPDLRGHGKSEGERGHSAGLAEVLRDLEAVADHLAYRMPEAPKVLVGQGLGALYALAYALERPGSLSALVLAGPLFTPRFRLPEPRKGLGRFFARLGPTSPGTLGRSPEDLTDDPAAQEALRADELAHDAVSLRAGQEAERAAARFWPRLGELSLPVLVLQGEADRIGDPARARGLEGPGVRVVSFPGQRHDPFLGSARETAGAALLEFLSARVATAS